MRKINLTDAELERLVRLLEWKIKMDTDKPIVNGYIESASGFLKMRVDSAVMEARARRAKSNIILNAILKKIR